MKPTLVLKMGQQLTMTPQLQQAIRLLQLSSLDLQQEVQEALEANPMLEMADDSDDDFSSSSADTAGNDDDAPATALPEPVALDAIDQHSHSEEEGNWNEQIPNDLPVDTQWEDIYQTSASSLPSQDDDDWDYTSRTGTGETLQSHLEWQLNLLPLSDTDHQIAIALIDGISADGYLEESLDDILASLDPSLEVELDEIEMVLHRIQQFEPTGVGARNLSECLHLQLQQLPDSTPMLEQAKRIVRDHLELLGSRDFTQLMRRSRLKEDQLREVVALIQTLNPRPGGEIASGEAEYVIPDVIVRRDQNRWIVELNQEAAPKVRVNSQYASMVKRADSSSDNTYLRNHLQEARWFIKSLQSRNETLMKVASQIVEHQRGFLEHGEEAMKPLVLNVIAEAVGMHESTISRVTTQKYMHTPRGIFELKYFFSSHVSTAEGGEFSSTAIRALIRKLVAAENPKKPLSDSKIAGLLEEQGIHVARRTIAKYRESLNIAPSSERKRLV
ncbi:RNA polymerase, sigma 54 subunit, RpoN/SigL [Halopseudomonas litoralis]|uniref:RNA polymerase sigma-54 factor n=1 Tax=Halopseudomonas litoralis TaxID=797277 RepID=A0A1H1LK20_9GAMM|nr:RNA polymerase factor sigma-54 [Halopseudomonas litoralis]SDR74893.1 RNA polymerase, sigma 54 subunit, RpoN/SigL [Halopseudomonas litoralis]